jgi:signal transduction histidine kinase/ActR/RegA family two-component response regulator
MPSSAVPDPFAASRSKVAALVRDLDWSATPIGPIAQWPQSLRSVVSLMLNSAFPMFVAWGPQLATIYNDGYVQIMGGKHPWGMGKPFLEIWSEIRADLQPFLEEVQAGRTFYRENLPLTLDRNGYPEETWFTFSWSPVLDEHGGFQGIFCACTETTRAMLAERHIRNERERLALLFQQAPGFVAVVRGPEHVFDTYNEAYMQLVGFRDLTGKPVREALPELAGQGFLKLLDQVYATGKPYRGDAVQVQLNRKPGGAATRVFVDFVFQPLRDQAGAVQGLFVQGHEVTEQRLAQDALREADRRKDEFLATLAHELRNPLAPITTAVHLLGLSTATEEVRARAVDVIGRQVSHMAHLLDDLIDVARITQNRLRLKKKVVTVTSLVDQCVEAVRPLVEARQHQLDVEVGDPLARVLVDPVRVTQVLTNLLNNAAKYTDPRGRIQLAVSVDGDLLQASVTDNGIGISPSSIDKLFRMFEQEVTALERSEGGLGVGLALVKGLVDLHGGNVRAFSEGPGKGSRFTVEIPCVQQEAREAAAGEPGARPQGPRLKVVLADDNADALQTLAEFLRIEGHEVHTAANGRAALELARSCDPDVMVLDIGMPGLNGYQVATEIRSHTGLRQPYLVAATGWGQEEDRQKSAAAGFDVHLTKPFDARMLASLIAVSRPATAER